MKNVRRFDSVTIHKHANIGTLCSTLTTAENIYITANAANDIQNIDNDNATLKS